MNLVMRKWSKLSLLCRFLIVLSYLDVCFSEKGHFAFTAFSGSIFQTLTPHSFALIYGALQRYE